VHTETVGFEGCEKATVSNSKSSCYSTCNFTLGRSLEMQGMVFLGVNALWKTVINQQWRGTNGKTCYLSFKRDNFRDSSILGFQLFIAENLFISSVCVVSQFMSHFLTKGELTETINPL